MALIVCSSIALSACGGGDDTAGTAPRVATDALSPTVSTPTAPAPTDPGPTATEPAPAATEPSAGTPAPVPPPTPTTTTEIGEGDTEAAVIPVDLTISGSTVSPGRVSVPAFLTIAFSARSSDGREHAVGLRTPRGTVTVNVPAGGAASTEIPGLPAGEYLIALDGQATDARLVVGVEPGP